MVQVSVAHSQLREGSEYRQMQKGKRRPKGPARRGLGMLAARGGLAAESQIGYRGSSTNASTRGFWPTFVTFDRSMIIRNRRSTLGTIG